MTEQNQEQTQEKSLEDKMKNTLTLKEFLDADTITRLGDHIHTSGIDRTDVEKIAKSIAYKIKNCIRDRDEDSSRMFVGVGDNIILDYPFSSVNEDYEHLEFMQYLGLVWNAGTKEKRDYRLKKEALRLYRSLKEEGYYLDTKK